jgi:threonine dehydrogenase-like Zn-dependent dehydrogenase
LAALLATQRDLDVHVFDLAEQGPKPELVADIGATYHNGALEEAIKDADVVVEATGVAQVVVDVMRQTAPSGIVCLTGVPAATSGPPPKPWHRPILAGSSESSPVGFYQSGGPKPSSVARTT